MAENLGKRPSKGILKTSSSFDNQEAPSRATKETKWDEMNIMATLHPPEKDYGHMKIEEPKTPYSYEGVVDEEEEDQVDMSEVASKLSKSARPKIYDDDLKDEEEEEETPEERARRKAFEAKRKGHYREWEAVQLARKKLLEDDDEDEEEKAEEAQEETEETESNDEGEVNKVSGNEHTDNDITKIPCSFVPSSSNESSSQ